MLNHAKGGMVRFQRAYHHGCSPTSIIRARDSASRVCEGLYGSIQKGLFPRLLHYPCSVKCMGAVSIVNGNVCGRFRDVLA